MARSYNRCRTIAVLAIVAFATASGCSRYNYRERADKDVTGIISQKNVFPDWQVKNWHAYPDPRARFADTTNPDKPPYPPDDYAARLLSPNPQRPTKKAGVGRQDGEGYISLLQQWDAENRSEDATLARGASPIFTSPFAETPQPLPAQAKQQTQAFPKTQPTTTAKPIFAGSTPPQSKSPIVQTGGTTTPAWKPSVTVGERPAVKHAIPANTPGALRPSAAVNPPTATETRTPALPPAEPLEPQPQPLPQPVLPAPSEFGPWVPAKRVQNVVIISDRNGVPTITELRQPVVTLISGDDEKSPFVKPATAITQPPAILPPGPQPAPQPQPPAIPPPAIPPSEPGKLPGTPMGVVPLPPNLANNASSDLAAEYLRALESGQTGYRLKLDQAVELALLNAREFQDRREDLYLAALPVTLERFNFAAQALFTEQVVRQSTGRELTNAGEQWSLNTTGGVAKAFPTGALLLVRLANQVVIDLSGDKPQTSLSNLSLSLAQPLLRGGGYAVTLEDLTQSERTLLYAMRSYARFRKIFYVAIAAGGSYTNNPYGLQGLSPNLGRGIGGNLTAPNAGYLPLLQQLAVINNQRKNVTALERLLKLYQAFSEGGQQSELQVGQVEVQLLNSRGQLLGQVQGGQPSGIRGHLDTLDNFKLQLGLPVTVPLELDDTPLRPIREQLGRFEEVYAQIRQTELAAAKYNPAEPVAQSRARWRALLTESPLTKGTPFAKSISDRLDSWGPNKLNDEQFIARYGKLREERRVLLAARDKRLNDGVPEPEAEKRRLVALNAEIDLAEFERAMRAYETAAWEKRPAGPAREAAQANAFRDVLSAFYLLILEARNDRLVQVREKWPELPPLPLGDNDALTASLDEAYTAAIQTALANRFDLMNARGQVVDSWRQIAIQANSLQGVFDVRYDLNSTTPAGRNNTLGFSGDRSNHQLTFRAELPLVRRAERNNYRAALISYQRQRRTLMAFEDNIANDVRGDLRELRTLAQLYRIQQRVVDLGYSQVDNAQAILLEPPQPGVANNAAANAALTQQALQAQSNLVSAQNTLYQIWVAYQTARMTFYLDLEQLNLDDRGVWRDEYFNRTDSQPGTPGLWQKPGERLHAPQPVGGN